MLRSEGLAADPHSGAHREDSSTRDNPVQALGPLVQLGCLVGRAGIEVRLLKEPRIPWRHKDYTICKERL